MVYGIYLTEATGSSPYFYRNVLTVQGFLAGDKVDPKFIPSLKGDDKVIIRNTQTVFVLWCPHYFITTTSGYIHPVTEVFVPSAISHIAIG